MLFLLSMMAMAVCPRVPLARHTGKKLVYCKGDLVAKFAGQNVHKRLVNEEAYREKNYEPALKRAFLGTDEDILAGHFFLLINLSTGHLSTFAQALNPPTNLQGALL